ncbi:rho guanine nucleotide exchange factor TIAM2 isoform X1 [Hyla sarda]|uniref:rho guanine nucleotide exchange factor TIAM2 isoform X1 n=3 Tax=Hyla sarda TaxID=327740 RepID=UPI0024C26CA4|nr:rho guanine nucleotide exchange factor TIAM2 isoform X1 [Hyla sarda]XP_056423022.1 rho guanine nucleotide exchange factor TIAM2 isoform X1 [Hyla sarda]XP_056423023.1 rho guanine nucleotide exchange factor TIAM2 isoform X1 [Hyla sarda]XP_056423024.1 rho guanine nucleotide exchange factor TIAM2 isoform X1 [Hyla sarda]XP_056423025.1 rho guanine nucleotide exchange factor TIAM2 isoform X1 [Hyla sarda]XP_056423026.1 rho guanine nucleotide exchange factor TIAM2 isoform X1 [Hyla sarda]
MKREMGNSESQYSLQGTRSPGGSPLSDCKQKNCSLKIHSINVDEEKDWPSPGWGRTGSSASYKSRSLARTCLSQCKGNLPYSSRHGDVVLKGSKVCTHYKQRPNLAGECCQANNNTYLPDNGYHYVGVDPSVDHRGCNGHILSCYDIHDSMSAALQAEERKSPKVLIKTLGKLDGCLRVEFHNRGNGLPSEESDGPVQLLRYSPAMEMKEMTHHDPRRNSGMEYSASQGLSASDSGLRSSKGSSLSSDSSWYDCPWGNTRDINDLDGSYLTRSSLDTSVHGGLIPNESGILYNQRSSLSSLRELYDSDLQGGLTPGRLSDEYIGGHHTLSNRVSFASDIDVTSRVEHRGPAHYSSYTLPCRKSKPLTEDASKKDTLKSRMRRISDWTGSLSRKKRKLQEPKCKDASECFDSGIDGFTAETSSPPHLSSILWSGGSGPLAQPRNEHTSLIGSDAIRQNIYENFMRELELEKTNVEETATSTGTDSSNDSLSSLEQLDLLFEKEQGVVRKAGWLFFKPLITLQKEKKLELVNRRKWKQYWVTLKGCTLMFYETYEGNSAEQSTSPRYALFAEDSIVQSVPEHPKKENVFCLSNSLGDVYLFQATSQTDLENWVTAIHSACASLFAKKHGKEDTVRLLKSQTRSLMQKVDMDSKMKKMAELQLSIVNDPKNRKAIENQIQQWEQNLEKFNMDLFRMRCYLSSLQGGELPNPKSLLAAAGRPSKLALGRLGIFSVSSFHALICSRDESALRKRTFSLLHKVQIKKSLFSSLKGLDTLARRGKEKRPSITQVFDTNGSQSGSGAQIPPNLSGSNEHVEDLVNVYNSVPEVPQKESSWEIPIFVHFYDGHGVTVNLRPEHRVEDILNLACKVRQLDPGFFGLHIKRNVGENVEYYVPSPMDYIQEQVFDDLEIFPIGIYNVHLVKSEGKTDFGFAVAAQVDDHNSLTHIYVSYVHPDGLAYREGLRTKNEILFINGEAVTDLDLRKMEFLFSERSVLLSLRSCHADVKPSLTSSWPENYIFKDQMRPLPPVNQSQLLEEFLNTFRRNSMKDLSNVPDVTIGTLKRSSTDDALDQVQCRPRIDQTYKSADQISALCRSLQEVNQDMMDRQNDSPDPPRRPLARHLSDADRLRKVIQELVDTEKSYVKDLSCLFELYLEPLQNETFLTQDEMDSLFGSLPEMLDFQKIFLQTLEDGISSSTDFEILETPSQFRKLLFSLGGSFLYYADHFKLYSGFCANHIKVQKVLERARTDPAFKEFLDARNPTKQHSSTLESYLIKPVQRVLKYPLLLKELVSLTDNESEEHYHLTEALKAMEKVASHINEMQKIYEDYGTVFDQLVAEQSGTEKEVTELSMGELLVYSTVTWLNIFPSLGKTRKELELTVFVFRRAIILVHKENFKLKKKTSQNTRSSQTYGDIDQFKFRWLIPLSAVQVRMGNAAGTENNCLWELIHTKSELQGRPETIFQLCSSDCESKTSTIKVIRSILRENLRRNIKCDLPLEKTNKDRLGPLRNRIPMSAKLASTRSLKVLKHNSSMDWGNSTRDKGNGNGLDSDDGSLSSGTQSSGCPTIESLLDSKNLSPVKHLKKNVVALPNTTVKESDILSDDEDDYRLSNVTPSSASMRNSPNQGIEVHFQNLNISEHSKTEPKYVEAKMIDAEGNFQHEEHPKLVRGHFCPIKRRVTSTRREKGITQAMKNHQQSLDSHSDSANIDLNAILEREFSIQSLTSVVNEECFYETVGNCGKL